MLHCSKQCGHTGMRWFAAHDRLRTLGEPIPMWTPLRDWIWIRWPLSRRFRRAGRDSRTILRCTKLCGRTGVRWFTAHDRLTTLRDYISVLTPLRELILVLTPLRDWIRRRCPLSLRLHRGGRDGGIMLQCTKLCGRGGAAVTWFAAHDRLTALHAFGGGRLGLRFHRGGRDRRTMLHCRKL